MMIFWESKGICQFLRSHKMLDGHFGQSFQTRKSKSNCGFEKKVDVIQGKWKWETAVTYAVVLLFLMVRPTGLFGRSLPKTTL